MAARGFILAGMQSGSGKTAVACMVLAALRSRGLDVRPCKTGPDFLDSAWHARYAGTPSRNLDTWMMGLDGVRSELARMPDDAICVVEGVMGLFDGGEAASDAGSAMELSRLTRWPVVLVLPCAKAGRSLAAAVRGFREEAGPGRIAGLILNQTGSENHAAYLREALEPLGLPVLGAVPHTEELRWGERHLGLCAAQECAGPDPETLARIGDRFLDIAALASLARELQWAGPEPDRDAAPARRLLEGVRVAVAEDDAFHFYYPANTAWLDDNGAVLARFSPVRDAALPPADALLIGGGFPESRAAEIAANSPMRDAVRDFSASGRPVFAECGGLMFLAEKLVGADGASHPMCGVVPGAVRMTGRLQHFGYSLCRWRGRELRGHEFHYSQWIDEEISANMWAVKKRRTGAERVEGWTGRRTAATYIHLWYPACPDFVAAALEP